MRRRLLSFRVPALEQAQQRPPRAADPDPSTPPVGVGLSWDREDAAVAAGECPWHPALDFPDTAELVRHIVRHARAWEAEAMHSERMRQAMREQLRQSRNLGSGT